MLECEWDFKKLTVVLLRTGLSSPAILEGTKRQTIGVLLSDAALIFFSTG